MVAIKCRGRLPSNVKATLPALVAGNEEVVGADWHSPIALESVVDDTGDSMAIAYICLWCI